MDSAEDESIIKDQDHVVLKRGDNLKHHQVNLNRQVYLEKNTRFSYNDIIGQRYGTLFEVKDGKALVIVEEHDGENTEQDGIDAECKDNRDLHDQDSNQKLTQDQIEQMKKDGVSGDHLIDKLIENSQTFELKTEFSKEKWVKKKKKKHVSQFRVMKPNTRLMCEVLWQKGPQKLGYLRYDTMAQMLSMGNVQANSTVVVVETGMSLVTAAVLERLGGFGKVVCFTQHTPQLRQQLEAYNFSDSVMSTLYPITLDNINSLQSTSSNTENLQAHVAKQKLGVHQKSQEVTVAESVPEVTKTDSLKSEDDSQQKESDKSINIDVAGVETEALEIKTASAEMETECGEETQNIKAENIESTEGKLATKDNENTDTQSKSQDQSKTTAISNGSKSVKADVQAWKKGNWDRKPAGEKRKKSRFEKGLERDETNLAARKIIEEGKVDCLLVACRFHPTPIVMELLQLVAPSRQVIVFSPFKESLEDCYVYMREQKCLVNYTLTETWLREYQVLPNRTHPVIQMVGTGGYLLSATTVVKSETETPKHGRPKP